MVRFSLVHEPSDTAPDPSGDTRDVTCENCGASLTPMEYEPLDDSGYNAAIHFCDDERLADWKASQ